MRTIFTFPAETYLSTLVIRANGDNGGLITWHDGGGSIGGHLNPDDAVTMDLVSKFIKAEDLTLSGANGDAVELTVIG